MSTYGKGSEWRKWDLHVHTPKSVVQQFGGDTPAAWDKYIQTIASLPEAIKVLAITDYLFCDGYEYLISRRSEIRNIELLIPNIEFRLNTFSGTANSQKRHNFHVLFDPAVSIQDIREQLLNCLSTGYKIQDGTVWRQTPTRRSLEELGRQMKAAAPSENSIQNKSDLQVGFDNITYRREDLEALLGKSCFQGKFVIANGYSEWDQSRWDQSAAEKRTLINLAHFSLTCLDDPAAIEANRKDLAINKLNSLVVHSSDAHDLNRLGKTMLWIKADPTFAGLKQVLNEPEARVYVGDSPPNFKPDHHVISRISIPKSNGWFGDNFELSLNRDLVAIIGGRGSGKSALAEAIAFGAGSEDESADAFLKKAGKHPESITGTEISLDWSDGSRTTFTIGELTEDQGLIRHLPQGVVEELCSHKSSEKLQTQIENVIFQALDNAQRMGASDFDELRTRILGAFEFEKDEAVSAIRDKNAKLTALTELIESLPGKEKLLAEKRKELEQLNKSLPELPPEDKKGQEELSALSELKKKFEAKIVVLQFQLSRINTIETSVKVFKAKIKEFRDGLEPHLDALAIADRSAFDLTLNETGINAALSAKKNEVSRLIGVLQGGEKADVATLLSLPIAQLPFANLKALSAGIDEKQKLTRAFETTKLKYQQQKQAALAVEGTIKALETEISQIKIAAAQDKDRLERERIDAYCSYFDHLRKEKDQIELLYAPLQASLSTGTDTDKKLVFEAKIDYQIEAHTRSGLDIIDRTRKGNFRELTSLRAALENFHRKCAQRSFDKSTIEAELNGLIDVFTKCDGAPIAVRDQLREDFGANDFYNWLFDPSKFRIVSSLKFDDTDLYLLSQGQKGIILLMLFLEIDKGDSRPLIIDQPEENLDNLSVYKDLIKYFRDRKQFRQIIIVTHNPNLVVNTDAEQIIVANYSGKRSPRLLYTSGSLEDQANLIPDTPLEQLDDGIIEQVCNILEGGTPAFEKRKKKYQISRKSQGI